MKVSRRVMMRVERLWEMGPSTLRIKVKATLRARMVTRRKTRPPPKTTRAPVAKVASSSGTWALPGRMARRPKNRPTPVTPSAMRSTTTEAMPPTKGTPERGEEEGAHELPQAQGEEEGGGEADAGRGEDLALGGLAQGRHQEVPAGHAEDVADQLTHQEQGQDPPVAPAEPRPHVAQVHVMEGPPEAQDRAQEGDGALDREREVTPPRRHRHRFGHGPSYPSAGGISKVK
jgi:hypothetical protein